MTPPVPALPLNDEDALRLRHGDAAARAELARLTQSDPDLAARLAEWDRQDAAVVALYAPVADEPVPSRLHAVLKMPDASPSQRWKVAAAIGFLAFGFAGGWGAARLAGPVPATTIADAAMASFATYAVEVLHPVEVAASDEAHLVQWLSKRLGTPIRTPDLLSEGFRLIGGRLLPGDKSPAALLMYEDDLGRRLTLYLTRSDGEASELAFAEAPGRQAFWWVDGSLGCALVGDLPRDTLRRLAIAAYHDLTEA